MGSSSIVEAIKPQDTGRQPWEEYFMSLAEHIATRSTCSRLRVGAIFVKESRILCSGYNGSLSGQPHCDDVGCLVSGNHCIRTVHAETNAICQAANHGVSLHGSYLYVTHIPCINCYKIVLASGCSRVYYRNWYGGTSIDTYREFQGMSRLEQI